MDQNDFETPILTVDVVLFTIHEGRLCVLLDTRDRSPFTGKLALIGGYIHPQTDLDTHGAARRVLSHKVGLEVPYLEQLAVFSGKDRDPRGWSATVAYISMARIESDRLGNFYPVHELPSELAFDHQMIIEWALERIRNKTSYSSLPLYMMPPEFTLTELQRMYEFMMGTTMDKATFRRKINETGIIEPTGMKMGTYHRPAELFRASTKKLSLFQHGII